MIILLTAYFKHWIYIFTSFFTYFSFYFLSFGSSFELGQKSKLYCWITVLKKGLEY